MKISINWLQDYIDLSGIPLEEIIHKISVAGLEVEDVIDQSKSFENIVVGFVKEKKKHPNADKLSVCIVNDGNEDFNVVCGAPNVSQGQKVAFAKVGAVIPSNGIKLENVKIRGEISAGMICSEKELGISENHEGILVLNSNFENGTKLSDALGFNDIILEIAITPNRADALSHIGIARDLAAIFNRDLKYPEFKLSESGSFSSEYAKVEIVDSKNCPRYVAKVVKGVTIKESPDWLKKKLKNIGLRPINNVVDVTNFVLYEVCQPLHAFDLDNLSGKKIIVKCASENEKFVTLDSKERILKSTDLMICDDSRPVAIGGVMGGENSEVTANTTNILIESAYFNPSSIRKTAKRLGLSTDASYRFERGADICITKWAAQRAAQLIQETAGGEILAGEIDVYPSVIQPDNVNLRFSRLSKILGYSIAPQIVKDILTKLGFTIILENDIEILFSVPSYRHDIEREIDIIEEVARIYGYDHIPEINKVNTTLDNKIDQSSFNDNVRNILISIGFFEIVTNSLLKESLANKFGKPIKMLNPQSSEMSDLRPSLIPGTMQAISNNIKVNEKNLRFFEIGKVFKKLTDNDISSFNDFSEKEDLIIALTGKSIESEWYAEDKKYDFFDLKGFVESFLKKLFSKTEFNYVVMSDNEFFDQALSIQYNDMLIGSGGRIKTELQQLFDVNQEIFVFILNLDSLKMIKEPERKFIELLKFPKIYRDFAFILDKSIESDKVIGVIKEVSSKLLHQIKLFDIFQSDSLGKDKKSLAFQLQYYDSSRTLTEEEVNKEFRKLIKTVEKTFNAQLRGA